MSSKIPVTIVSGFLGAGKTTLINKVLKEKHGEHIAVVINEFGEIGVDHQFVLDVEEEIYQMDNGCLCCTLRTDIADMLKSILMVKEQNGIKVDRVLFETTGLADPAPIAQTFINVPFLNEHFILDAVLTVVDSKNFLYQTTHQTEPAKQVGFADKIFMSKHSLVDDTIYTKVINEVRSINPFAEIQDLDARPVEMKDMFGLELFYASEKKILEMQENSTSNNSENLGSADGKKLDKETTIIIEKISSLNDIDVLNSELHLSQSVIDILKKYAPSVYYTVDNSEGYDKIYFRLGGYLVDRKVNGINEIIGSYKVDAGKLTSTGEDLGKVGSKINDGDLTWKQLNLNNKVHDKDAAKAVANKFFAVGLGGGVDSMLGIFAYSSDFSKHVTDAQLGLTVVPMSLAEITDMYNAATSDTYNADQVYKKVSGLKQAKYREVDDSYKGNESKYNKSIGNGEVLYFKKDKMYLAAFGGIGGAMGMTLTSPDKWTEEGDKIIIPLINNFEGGKIKGQMVLRLNNKVYEGGQSRSKYYIESRTNN